MSFGFAHTLARRPARSPAPIQSWLGGVPVVAASVGAALAEAWAYLIKEPFPDRIHAAWVRLNEQEAGESYWRRYF